MSGVTLSATHGHQRAFFEMLGGVTTSHHRRDTQFARNDGGVTGPSATVGHDSASALHHGLPIGIGHIGDQHVARLHFVHLADVVYQADGTGSDFLPNRTAMRQHRAVAFEFVAQLRLAFLLALHCLGARLQDVEQTVVAVFAPFDVHGATVMLFDDQCILGELLHLSICQ